LLLNWFFAANIVCAASGGQPYQSSSLVDAMIVKNLPLTTNASVNASDVSLLNGGNNVRDDAVSDSNFSIYNSKSTLFAIFSSTATRKEYISNSGSFSAVVEKDSDSVKYYCNDSGDVGLKIFGIKDLLSVQTLILVTLIGCVLWFMKFMSIF